MNSAELLARLKRHYQATDELLEGWSCDSSTDCCHFGRTGREPYLLAIEFELVAARLKAQPIKKEPSQTTRRGHRLAIVDDERRCPLLDPQGKCRVYDVRPFGCRTFFCERASGPGRMPRTQTRDELRQISALNEQFIKQSIKNKTQPREARTLSAWLSER